MLGFRNHQSGVESTTLNRNALGLPKRRVPIARILMFVIVGGALIELYGLPHVRLNQTPQGGRGEAGYWSVTGLHRIPPRATGGRHPVIRLIKLDKPVWKFAVDGAQQVWSLVSGEINGFKQEQ